MRSQSIHMGRNRTGMSMHPLAGPAMLESSELLLRTVSPDGDALRRAREDFTSGVGVIGTMPPPATLKGAATTMLQMVKGNKPTVFLDALGDRIAFERTGTRLYEALIAKVNAEGTFEGGPTLEMLETIRNQEMQHFAMLYESMVELGGDPTVQTPSADVTGVMSLGLVQVLSDPRVTVLQALHTVHVAELVDNDCWVLLSELASSLGYDELSARFLLAESEEAEHLETVRAWVRAGRTNDAFMALEAASP